MIHFQTVPILCSMIFSFVCQIERQQTTYHSVKSLQSSQKEISALKCLLCYYVFSNYPVQPNCLTLCPSKFPYCRYQTSQKYRELSCTYLLSAIINKMGNSMCCVSPPKQDEIPQSVKPTTPYYGEGPKMLTLDQFNTLLADQRSQTPEILYLASLLQCQNQL